jgi:hypothetical protein
MAQLQSNLFCIQVVSATLPAWISAGVSLSTWYYIPNTSNTNVDLDPPLPSNPYNYYLTGPRSKLLNWGDLGYDPSRIELWSNGGGHADYSGNEVDKLVLGTTTPGWVNVRPFTSAQYIPTIPSASQRMYLDGRPASFHSYYSLFFSVPTNRFLRVGSGALWGTGGGSSSHCEVFDVSAGDWWTSVQASTQGLGAGSSGAGVVGGGKTQHPVTGDVWYIVVGSAQLMKMDINTYVFSTIGGTGISLDQYGALGIDPNRNIMLKGPDNSVNQWRVINLATASASVVSVSGFTSFSPAYGNMSWDSTGQRLIFVDRNANVVAIDTSLWVATKVSIGGTIPVTATSGLFKKGFYSNELKGIIYIPEHNRPATYARLYE